MYLSGVLVICESNNMNQKDIMCLKEIRQFARNLLIIISCQHKSVPTQLSYASIPKLHDKYHTKHSS
jgi:hypothetical protein